MDAMFAMFVSWLPFVLLMIAPFAFVGFLVWLALRKKGESQTQHAEVQKEIIGKFSTAAEMQEFLKSEEGKRLFKSTGGGGSQSPMERAISRIGVGIVLIVIGAGLMVLAHYGDQSQYQGLDSVQAPPPGIPAPIPNAPTPPSGPFFFVPPGLAFPAAAILLTGVGLVISALVTLKLSQRENPAS